MLRLPPFAGASGDGMKSLPPSLSAAGFGVAYPTTSSNDATKGALGSASAPDPVAERRRERALKALDKKLAELRSSIRAPANGGSPGSQAGSPGTFGSAQSLSSISAAGPAGTHSGDAGEAASGSIVETGPGSARAASAVEGDHSATSAVQVGGI